MGLPPVTLIEGDETLLTLEAADKIRALALTHGFEREVLDVGPGFVWARLMEARTELSPVRPGQLARNCACRKANWTPKPIRRWAITWKIRHHKRNSLFSAPRLRSVS